MTKRSNEQENDLERVAERLKKKDGVQHLLQSDDTKRMMDMLNKQGGVQAAAKAAAAGDPSRLMEMMQQLMSTKEGSQLVERITKQAQQNGL